jgi:hypothetical protein
MEPIIRNCKECKNPIPPSSWSRIKIGIAQFGKKKGWTSHTRTAICQLCTKTNYTYEYFKPKKSNGAKIKDLNIEILRRHCKKCKKPITKSYWHMRPSVIVKGKHAGDQCFIISATCPHCKTKNSHHRYRWYEDWSKRQEKSENWKTVEKKDVKVHITMQDIRELNETEKLAVSVIAHKYECSQELVIAKMKGTAEIVLLEQMSAKIDKILSNTQEIK